MHQWCEAVRGKCERKSERHGFSDSGQFYCASNDPNFSQLLSLGARKWGRAAIESGHFATPWGGRVHKWRLEQCVARNEVAELRQVEDQCLQLAEEEEKSHSSRRIKEFRAWAKRATAGCARGAFSYARKPGAWRPEGARGRGGITFCEEDFLREQARQWQDVWQGSQDAAH